MQKELKAEMERLKSQFIFKVCSCISSIPCLPLNSSNMRWKAHLGNRHCLCAQRGSSKIFLRHLWPCLLRSKAGIGMRVPTPFLNSPLCELESPPILAELRRNQGNCPNLWDSRTLSQTPHLFGRVLAILGLKKKQKHPPTHHTAARYLLPAQFHSHKLSPILRCLIPKT